jgi:hypothetical protein
MIKPIKEPLSTVASVAIRQSIKDIEVIEEHPDHSIDMDQWGVIDDGYCEVCHAGAIQLRRGIRSKNLRWSMDNKVTAFNYLRLGEIKDFLRRFYDGWIIESYNVPGFEYYEDSPTEYKQWCLKVADKLEEMGL